MRDRKQDNMNWRESGRRSEQRERGYGEDASERGTRERYRGADWDRDVQQAGWRGQDDRGTENIGRGSYAGSSEDETDYGSESWQDQRQYGSRGSDQYGRHGGAQRGEEDAGYGGGATLHRGMGRSYGQRSMHGTLEQDRTYGRSGGGYSTGHDAGAYGGQTERRGFNDRWETAYGGASGSQRGMGQGQYGSSQRGMGQGQYGSSSRRGLGPRNYVRSDERIHEDLCERLMDDDYVDASEIDVRVRNGTVTLSGTVDERWEKYRAEDIADGCSGVRDVENQLRVSSSQSWRNDEATSTISSGSSTSGSTSGSTSATSGGQRDTGGSSAGTGSSGSGSTGAGTTTGSGQGTGGSTGTTTPSASGHSG